MALLCSLVFLTITVVLRVSTVEGFCNVHSLMHQYHLCTIDHPQLSSLNKHPTASGQDVIDIFNGFCAARDAIHSCTIDNLKAYHCPTEENLEYKLRLMMATSEWYCDGEHVKPFVTEMYVEIPEVSTTHTPDPCMKHALVDKKRCHIEIIHGLLNEGVHNVLIRQAASMGGMLCTIKSFENEQCPIHESILTTTLAYAHGIVSPVLGVNVSRILSSLQHHKQVQIELAARGGGEVNMKEVEEPPEHKKSAGS